MENSIKPTREELEKFVKAWISEHPHLAVKEAVKAHVRWRDCKCYLASIEVNEFDTIVLKQK